MNKDWSQPRMSRDNIVKYRIYYQVRVPTSSALFFSLSIRTSVSNAFYQYLLISFFWFFARKERSSRVFPPATLLKKRLWHRCFPVNFAVSNLKFYEEFWSFSEHLFLQNTCGGCFCMKSGFNKQRIDEALFWRNILLCPKCGICGILGPKINTFELSCKSVQ